MRWAGAILPGLLAGCATAPALHVPPPGINEVLTGPIASAPGSNVVMGDLNMGPGATIPRHTHAGEEFLYILAGAATVSRQGEPDLTLQPGQSVRIAPGVVHWGTAGPEGMRAVTAWIKLDGQPLRTPVPE